MLLQLDSRRPCWKGSTWYTEPRVSRSATRRSCAHAATRAHAPEHLARMRLSSTAASEAERGSGQGQMRNTAPCAHAPGHYTIAGRTDKDRSCKRARVFAEKLALHAHLQERRASKFCTLARCAPDALIHRVLHGRPTHPFQDLYILSTQRIPWPQTVVQGCGWHCLALKLCKCCKCCSWGPLAMGVCCKKKPLERHTRSFICWIWPHADHAKVPFADHGRDMLTRA